MIQLKGVTKKHSQQVILNNISLTINDGDFFCIYGPSGSGKTTLLNILGLLEFPDHGNVIFAGEGNHSKRSITKLQLGKIGYVFQNFGLLVNESVADNLQIALKSFSYSKSESQKRMIDSLAQVQLGNILNQKVYELSGGEQQRVALARLILKKATYIFADEPTGNLDDENTEIVFNVLKQLNKEKGATVVYVTHNKELIRRASKSVELT